MAKTQIITKKILLDAWTAVCVETLKITAEEWESQPPLARAGYILWSSNGNVEQALDEAMHRFDQVKRRPKERRIWKEICFMLLIVSDDPDKTLTNLLHVE